MNWPDDGGDSKQKVLVLVSPWLGMPVPYFSMEIGRALAASGCNVSFLRDMVNVFFHDPRPRELKAIGETLDVLAKSYGVLDLPVAEAADCSGDEKDLREIVAENAVRFGGGESTVAGVKYSWESNKVPVDYLREEEPLGTGGCLSLLPERPQHDVLVCNGDLVTQVDFDAMLRFHAEGGFAATVGASPYTHTIPFGVLQSKGDCLESIEEKPVLTHEINAGVYVLSPGVVAGIPRRFYLITEAISSLLDQKCPVGIYSMEDDWIDVGEREQLMRARGEQLPVG